MSLFGHGLVKPFRRLYEAFRRPSGDFLTSTQEKLGVYPEISFKTMTQVYLADLATRASIDFLADQIVGAGFHTAMNEEYAETSEEKTAKEIVDEFCKETNLDIVLQDTVKYLVGWGNAFWWVGNQKRIEFLKLVPIEIIQKIHFSEGEVAKLVLEWHREPKEIIGDELIHLAYNRLTAEPLGIGILYSLCAPLPVGNGDTREPFYQIKGKIHKGMAEVIYKWGAPNELWILPGLSKAKLDEAHKTIKNLPMKGARFTTSTKDARVYPIIAERMRGLDFYVETLEDEFVLGLETPLAKLVTKTGFTEASANAALQIGERRVMALQRFIKRSVERHLFDRVVKQAGLDPAQAQVRLNWGMPEKPEIEALLPVLAQIATARPDIISTEEFRDILISMGLPIRRRKVTAPVTPTRTQPPQILGVSKPEQPIVSARKKHEMKPRMAGGSRFLLQESPDWCADAGGHWITYDGKHLCIDIQDYQKIPKEIRDEVAQGEREHRKATAKRAKTAEYHKRNKLAKKSASNFPEKDRKAAETELRKYELKDLETVKDFHVLDDREFNEAYGEGGRVVAGFYRGSTEEIYVRRESWSRHLHHEMGHHIDKMRGNKTSERFYKFTNTTVKREAIMKHLGSSYYTIPSELFAESFNQMTMYPHTTARYMREDTFLNDIYEEVMDYSGYHRIKKKYLRRGE